MKTRIHRSADVKTKNIGIGTVVWQNTVIMEGVEIGKDCNINAHCFVEKGVTIGDRVTLKCGVYLWHGLRVEDDVFIGPNATFTNDMYPRSRRQVQHPVTILKKGCSLGANATILAGLTIGEYALVGAGAVVTKSVPSYSIWYGNPATHKGYICSCSHKLEGSTVICPKCGNAYKSDGFNGLRR